MYYEKLAEEFIHIRTRMLKSPQNQQISRAMQGEKAVLDFLMAHGKKAHPKELSRMLAVSSARIACILNHMEEKELVIRTADESDNRQTIVVLTEKGTAISRKQHLELQRRIAQMLEDLGPEDADALLRITKKIADGFEKTEKIPGKERICD